MDYTHTFELHFSNDHQHIVDGQVSFDHGGHITLKFDEALEATVPEIQQVTHIFQALGTACSQLGDIDKIEIVKKK